MKYDDTTHYLKVKDSYGVWHNALYYNYNTPVGLIPIMTSNTTPSGTVTGSGFDNNSLAWGSFNGGHFYEGRTIPNFVNNGTSAYLQYEFENDVQFTSVYISLHDYRCPNTVTVTLQGSNDGTNWTDLAPVLSVAGGNNMHTDHEYTVDISDMNTYNYFRCSYSGTYLRYSASNYIWAPYSVQPYGFNVN